MGDTLRCRIYGITATIVDISGTNRRAHFLYVRCEAIGDFAMRVESLKKGRWELIKKDKTT